MFGAIYPLYAVTLRPSLLAYPAQIATKHTSPIPVTCISQSTSSIRPLGSSRNSARYARDFFFFCVAQLTFYRCRGVQLVIFASLASCFGRSVRSTAENATAASFAWITTCVLTISRLLLPSYFIHHKCPWVGTCVGYRNHHWFMTWLICVAISLWSWELWALFCML